VPGPHAILKLTDRRERRRARASWTLAGTAPARRAARPSGFIAAGANSIANVNFLQVGALTASANRVRINSEHTDSDA